MYEELCQGSRQGAAMFVGALVGAALVLHVQIVGPLAIAVSVLLTH